ncbi:hypothetical protein B0T16DRAFT_136317 [Cercophora newfieldiana]|uniref:G domain-containing protein n=1 Tax=Cercophora newfieldiana TaxID=92897 RepID=A0AA39YDX5_9PEZI|nr:hypothetical protein B0T16DRAFT_136317 [Cercophora newfieldiana]
MGMTGSGKSTFISHFCRTARGDHGLRSATARVEAHVGNHPDFPDRRVIFVDTPGFDDTLRTDTEVLREIVNWLNVTYAQNIKVCGIVYLHGVNVPRVSGAAHATMRLFRELCGDESMASVVLATSHWSQSPMERASQELRHEQLVGDDAFWRRMERNGARVFKHDRGEISARAIVHYLLNRAGGGVNLRVQREMAEGRTLDQTAVGMALERRMEEMRASYERELGNLKRELEEARRQTAQNQQRIEEINEDRLRLEERLDEEKAYRRQLRKNLKQLQRERSEERRNERRHREQGTRRHSQKQKECVIM